MKTKEVIFLKSIAEWGFVFFMVLAADGLYSLVSDGIKPFTALGFVICFALALSAFELLKIGLEKSERTCV